ncbi:unnamed protein product [Rotaria sp. Silwood2]|nr:unnamed protein product [Rotaria sp. Silwood2]CAF4094223.1 unnamed protein product [Rotaria sp. Silwood2]
MSSEDSSSSVIEYQSDPSDSINLTTVSSSIITLSSNYIPNSTSSNKEFTIERIIVKNTNNNLSSICWNLFGFPAKKSKTNHQFQPIPGFVSCESCLQTYSFQSAFGTRVLNAHSCIQKLSNDKTSSWIAGTGIQTKLETMIKCYKHIQLPGKEINSVKDLVSKWLCQDMRAFSIVEDTGLRNLLQKFIVLGKCAAYGAIDVKSVMRGADVSSKHIYKLVDDYRIKLKDILKEPYESKCICACPDTWSDPHKQISYMGISISFVDENFKYIIFDLWCEPYLQDDHTDPSIQTSGCNKDIQGLGGVALQQSTVIRWLSMIDLLQSIVRSY